MKIQTNNSPKETKVENTTWLQGVGHCYGKKAIELKNNDTIVFNYGSTYKIISVEKETKSFITFKIESGKSNEIFSQKFKKDRIVAIAI